MAHFAKLDSNNIVTFVTVGRQEDDGKEQELSQRTGDVYKQTSYNTHCGIHYDPNTNQPSQDQSKSYRKNYAGVGYTYDYIKDAFISPKPYTDWLLNETSCCWESPIPYPNDNKNYYWDENTHTWVLMN